MKKLSGIILVGSLLIPAIGSAATHSTPVNKWTCEDFLALDASFQPTAVGFAEALNSKDKPEDAVLDVDGIETVTPAVIQACTADKSASFKTKVDDEWKKVKKHL
ncbi:MULTISPECIES: acid-activated periplasmic chaperone HdeA [Winslowiella]|uniref:acid-activated periplasmic chaperone HdeA n=1 Tax=Winslowiella TaxID=2997349 RepID=UPI0028BE5EFD|nr:acid-activated periplasmic chaperone HdeA [Winslowiella toletana]WNN42450.1 acid-activated periplasmic chaperone HdeA [Winslowiella toletana]